MFGEVGIRQSQWWGFMFHHSLFEKMMKEKKAKAEEKGKLGYDQREKAKKRKKQWRAKLGTTLEQLLPLTF